MFKATQFLRKNILLKKKIGILHLDCIRFSKHSGPTVSINDQKSTYRITNEHIQIKKMDPIDILSAYIVKNNYLKKIELEKIKKKTNSDAQKEFETIFKKISIRKI